MSDINIGWRGFLSASCTSYITWIQASTIACSLLHLLPPLPPLPTKHTQKLKKLACLVWKHHIYACCSYFCSGGGGGGGRDYYKVTIQYNWKWQNPTTMFTSRIPIFGLDEYVYIFLSLSIYIYIYIYIHASWCCLASTPASQGNTMMHAQLVHGFESWSAQKKNCQTDLKIWSN